MSAGDDRARVGWVAHLRAAGTAPAEAEGLARFLSMLGRWAAATDLVGRFDVDALVVRVEASLAGLPWLPARGRLLDIGSGNGFPAIPLLLARPGVSGVMLEPRERRWAFLREVVRDLGLNAEVRRERLGVHRSAGYDVVTVQGVAAAAWAASVDEHLSPSGTLLWWTSQSRATTLRAAVRCGRVLECALPSPERGVLVVWQRCST